MYAAPGIGLAAPQIGVGERLVVIDLAREHETPRPLQLVNPEIIWQSDEMIIWNEGCLSIPDYYADVTRHREVAVRYLDQHCQTQEIKANDLLAVCLQHEIDHLNGVLFIDHISALRWQMALGKMRKLKRGEGRPVD